VGRLTGEPESGKGVQKVNIGDAPVVGDVEEDADGVKRWTESSKT
jgi:hypothetical protein